MKTAVSLLLLAGSAQGGQADQDEGRLKQMSLQQLGNIEVTTVSKAPVTVARTAAAIYVITQEDIRRSGATTIPEALRLAPGIEVAQSDSVKWSVGIRGFGSLLSRAVLVLIDGRSLYSPLFRGVHWKLQDTLIEDIDRIEVIRGPGGTIWGANAVNGVINIITKSAKDTHGSLVSAGGGNVDQGFLDYRYGGSNDKGFHYRVYGKGFTRGPEFHPDHRQFDDWRRTQGGFRTDWDATNRDTLTIQGDFYSGLAGESYSITSLSPPSATVVNQNSELSGGNLLAQWRRVLRAGSDLQVQAYYDRVSRRQVNQAEFRDTFDFDFVHHLTLPPRQDFTWGLGARASLGDVPQVVPTSIFTPSKRTDQLYSAFVQDQIALVGEQLWLTVGSKFLHNSFTGFEAEPSAQILWTPTDRQTAWAAVTRAVRTPSDNEDYAQTTTFRSANPLTFSRTSGDGRFLSETLIGYEAGYRNLPAQNFYLDVVAFYNKYDHLLSTEPGAPFTESSPAPTHLVIPSLIGNGIRGHTSGFEIAPNWKPARWWRLAGSYSYLLMDMQRAPGSLDTTTVRSLEGSSPHHQALVQSFLDLPGSVEFSQTYRYVSDLPAQLVPSYGTADGRLSWRRVQHFEFAVVGQNLLQPHHAEFGGNPGPLVGIKRSVYGAITWRR